MSNPRVPLRISSVAVFASLIVFLGCHQSRLVETASAQAPAILLDSGAPTWTPRWESKVRGGAISAIAISADGFMVSGNVLGLSVHASDDGRILDPPLAATTCPIAEGGIRMLSAKQAAVVCANGQIHTVTFPELEHRVVADVGGFVKMAAWGRDVVAVGGQRAIAVFSMSDWSVAASWPTDVLVRSIAFGADDATLAVALDRSTEIELRNITTEQTQFRPAGGAPVLLASSSDRRLMFIGTQQGAATILDLTSGATWAGPVAASTVTWLHGRRILAASTEGLTVVTGDGDTAGPPVARSIPRPGSYTTVAASDDGQILCFGGNDGTVACDSVDAMPSSHYQPLPRRPTADHVVASPANTVVAVIAGYESGRRTLGLAFGDAAADAGTRWTIRFPEAEAELGTVHFFALDRSFGGCGAAATFEAVDGAITDPTVQLTRGRVVWLVNGEREVREGSPPSQRPVTTPCRE